MSGTLVLSATVNRVFDDLFAKMGENIDAVVQGKVLFESETDGVQRANLDDNIVEKVRQVEGVKAAEGSIETYMLTLLDAKGEPMGGMGPPTVVGTWEQDSDINSFQVAEGRAPTKPGEAILDRGAIESGKLKVGKDISLITPKGTIKLKLVGASKFGEADSAGGATFIGTTLEQAQQLAGLPGKVSRISVIADDSTSSQQLVENLKAARLQDGINVITGEEASAQNASSVKEGLGFFTTMLLVFAGIALFVGWFIISNTFNILVAQRTRELALLRALGASRNQVLGSVQVEALLIGLFSAVVGFLVGVGLAKGAYSAMSAAGMGLPQAALVVTPSIALITIIAGLLITAFAAIAPAVRATRVPPLAALRDVAVDRTGHSKIRMAGSVILILLGAISILPAFKATPSSESIAGVGLGLVLLIFALLTAGPIIASPIARVVGSPLPKLRGVTGTLARQNAVRSPRRTAATASALIIGVALVAFITIFANSAQRSIDTAIGNGFQGDYIIGPVSQFNLAGISPSASKEISKIDGVKTVTSIGVTQGQITLPNGDKPSVFLGGIDTSTFEDVFTVRMTEGKLSDLTDHTIVVDSTLARDSDLAIGDKVKVISAIGKELELKVVALSNDPAMSGQWLVSRPTIDALSAEPTDLRLGVLAEPGTNIESLRKPIKDILKDYPTMKVQDREQFTSGIVKSITTLLNVVYALLAVSIIIALIGITNTLSLSIHERTRELGLLRAVGMTRAQLRSSVRWEATIVALMGTVIGTVAGIGLSYTMVRVLKSQGITEFAIPTTGMVSVVIFGAALGVIASIRPARKAAKLNVLDAIAAD